MPKIKHFSISVFVGGNGYFVVIPFGSKDGTSDWASFEVMWKDKSNSLVLPPWAACLI